MVGNSGRLTAGASGGETPRGFSVALHQPVLSVGVNVATRWVEGETVERQRLQLEEERQQASADLVGQDTYLDEHGCVGKIGRADARPEDGREADLPAKRRAHELRRGAFAQAAFSWLGHCGLPPVLVLILSFSLEAEACQYAGRTLSPTIHRSLWLRVLAGSALKGGSNPLFGL